MVIQLTYNFIVLVKYNPCNLITGTLFFRKHLFDIRAIINVNIPPIQCFNTTANQNIKKKIINNAIQHYYPSLYVCVWLFWSIQSLWARSRPRISCLQYGLRHDKTCLHLNCNIFSIHVSMLKQCAPNPFI